MNVSDLALNADSETPIIAPLPFVKAGKTTVEVDIRRLEGLCQVLDTRGLGKINADWPESHRKYSDESDTFNTDNSKPWSVPSHSFYEDVVYGQRIQLRG